MKIVGDDASSSQKEIENMNRLNFGSVIASHIYIYVYSYDKGGNRETEKIYAFTTGDTLGEVIETKTSQYNYLVWKDRLSSFNGKAVKYDSAGNPTSYDGKTYKWDGRNLKEIALADGSKTQFDYDQNGLSIKNNSLINKKKRTGVAEYQSVFPHLYHQMLHLSKFVEISAFLIYKNYI